MSMQYRLAEDGLIEFRIPDLFRRSGWRIATANYPLTAHLDDIVLLCDSTVKMSGGAAVETQATNVSALQRKFNFLASRKGRLPKTDVEWKNFSLAHLTFHLTDTVFSNPSFSSRKSSWPMARALYQQLQLDGHMPWSVPILSLSMKGSTLGFEDSTARTVLGERRQKVEFKNKALPQKYLVDQTFALSDEEFIDVIESKLMIASSAVRDGCYEYWTKMKATHDNGRQLINSISTEQIEKVLASGEFGSKNRPCVCDPRSPMGINWFLAVANYYFHTDPNLTQISFRNLEKRYPFFSRLKSSNLFKKLVKLELRKVAGIGNDNRMQPTEILNRLLGLLSSRDCAAAAALLTIENPVFNSMPLQQAKLINENGDSFYAVTINGNVIFSVEKPRAVSRKVSSFSSLSEMIMDDVIQATQVIREKLMNCNDARYRFLFLVSHRSTLGTTNSIDSKLNGPSGLNLYNAIYLDERAPGVMPNTFTLSHIRNTEGIIEFLAKGSLASMAKKLGNTIQTLLGSYIPPWLIECWCERIIRRFQQKLVIVANAKTPWLIPASDFTCLEQITAFVKSMLTEGREGDAFTKAIEERFGSKNERKPAEAMFINLNPDSLAALYAYEDLTNNQLNQTGIGAFGEDESKLIALARLMRCVAENASSSAADFSANIELQGESSAEFKLIHEQACNLSGEFLQRYRTATTFYKD
ncbi:hypothetical protein [Pseudomonas syringae group genomosp. 3]|uniref:hypothetical protein n=1 Tax=Pseudomonas syringae group genomosp. 3 TaxID=251701 RepID=UPI0005C913B2|nr:hypothetical protein [Pseudomonas syringae group genomosp. 3]KPB98523.1 Uncharacterized protein AC506_4775 [Pseudomonas syringae pv. maculicola str. M6]